MKSFSRMLLLALAASLTPACSFHATATHWNGRVGPDGHPVFVKTATNLAINLLILLPFLGNTSMDEMVADITAEIAEKGGDHVRIVESSATNYWDALAFPGITFVITPVVSTLAVEYRPSPEEMDAVMAQQSTERRDAAHQKGQERVDIVPEANSRR